MMETWQWLLYVNIPIMVVNLLGMWISTCNVNPRMAKLTYWINVGALAFTMNGILTNSFLALCE